MWCGLGPGGRAAGWGRAAGSAHCCGCGRTLAPAQSSDWGGSGKVRWWRRSPTECNRRRTLSPRWTAWWSWRSTEDQGDVSFSHYYTNTHTNMYEYRLIRDGSSFHLLQFSSKRNRHWQHKHVHADILRSDLMKTFFLVQNRPEFLRVQRNQRRRA